MKRLNTKQSLQDTLSLAPVANADVNFGLEKTRKKNTIDKFSSEIQFT